MSTTQLGDTGARGGNARLLLDLRDPEAGGNGSLRLEPFSGDVWVWGYNGEEGLAEGFDEGVLAIGRAVGRRFGPAAQKQFLLEFVGVILSDCERHN